MYHQNKEVVFIDELNSSLHDKKIVPSEIQKKYSFDLFFLRFLNLFSSQLNNVLNKFKTQRKFSINFKNILHNNVNSFLDDIHFLCIRTLIYEINEKRMLNLLEGETSNERYNYFNESFQNQEFFVQFLNKYPVLTWLMETMIYNRVQLINDCLQRLSEDTSSIAKEIGIVFKEVLDVNVTSGDTHNKGKKVICVVTDEGKIMYKPHSLSTDLLFQQIIEYINNKNKLNCKIRSIPSIDNVDYGWQKFVEFKPCSNETEVSRFYYRLGINLAFLYIIGTTDIHFENLICCGEHPYIIDFETLIENKSFENTSRGLAQELYRHINESVLGTAVLPLNFKNSLFDFDMSALSTSNEQKSDFWKMHVILNDYSDEIYLKKEPGNILEGSNYVQFENQKVKPFNYIEDIICGFEESYQLVLDNKIEFNNFLMNLFKKQDIVVRQVLRPTSIYAKFVEASTHPKYLRNFEDRYKLMEKIKNKKVNVYSKKQIKREYFEIYALMTLDIPYFTTKMDSHDLNCNQQGKVDNFFPKTLQEILQKRLSRIGKKDLEFQLYYIRLSLSTTTKNNWLKDDKSFPRINPLIPYFKKGNSNLEYARDIGDVLGKYAIWNKDQSNCTWFVQNIENEKLKLGALNHLLYEGGGVILFLFHLAKETKSEKYYKLAYAGLKGLEDQISNVKIPKVLSAFNGIGSLIYLYYTIYQLYGHREAYDKYKYYIQELYTCDLHNSNLDYVSGLSGLLVLLTNIYDQEKDVAIIDICRKTGEYFYDQIKTKNETKLTGLSHGYSGIQLALMKTGKCLNNKKFLKLAKSLIYEENKYYNAEKNNWEDLRNGLNKQVDPVFWCHGAPGIALSRASILQYDGIDSNLIKQDISRAVEKLIKDGFSEKHDHSLCHGIYGNIDILISLGQLLNESKYLDIAINESNKCLNYIKKNLVKCGLNNTFDLLSFMVGLTGIGYTFLRLNNKNLPSVLSLDVNVVK
ncbi:type 2 lanthipeptide synthetase LanM family protein [Bacillus sp. CLL-7-23]|uniref:Type 2 lanthipeptide synthetase LanM family protein n=1 Tax=Bacillus changyiensis TaxID=3004103 RepID=A0ABT4WYJ6_9BACI|nr:type 2 lanthipeptide synthetase LanM family protein [Bacillus changyiensis]MDA7025119.1 type 2 lanthipeptide synthetase LanM family protein [Bacillus changyiensis]